MGKPTRVQKIKIIRELAARDGWECFYCEFELLDPEECGVVDPNKVRSYPTLDHFHPQSQFAARRRVSDNMVLSCAQCNARKANRGYVPVETIRRLRKQVRRQGNRIERMSVLIDHLKREKAEALNRIDHSRSLRGLIERESMRERVDA